jgi:hypothetical protein
LSEKTFDNMAKNVNKLGQIKHTPQLIHGLQNSRWGIPHVRVEKPGVIPQEQGSLA